MPAKTETMIERLVDGVPVVMTEYGYKTFSMVVKSIGYFTHRTSPTYFRTCGVMESWHGQPRVSPDYPRPSAEHITELYEKNRLMDFDSVVIGPGLETCCYIGRVLNVPVLPSQFTASAENREHVEKNSNAGNHYVVGHETDWPALCVWIKPRNLGELYSEMIGRAKNVIVFTANSGRGNCHGTPRGWVEGNISILDTFEGGQNFKDRIQEPEKGRYAAVHDHIPHWEFSMDDEQIGNLRRYCAAKGKRMISISSGDWEGFIPALLFKKLYEKNNLKPTGLVFNSYWVCHPFYESEFLKIPVVDFQYGADVFVAEFKKLLDAIPFQEKSAEYMVWPPELNWTKAVNPQARFESWGFGTAYKTERPYDVWCYGWNSEEDLKNPTREWIVPQLRGKKAFREFPNPVSIEELVDISQSVRKVDVAVT